MIYRKIRLRLYQILEKAQPGDIASIACDMFILTLIALNIIAIMLETVVSIEEKFHDYFILFNILSVIVFTIEYVLRIWVSVESDFPGTSIKKRVKYIFSPMAIIDLLAILPFYLAFFPIDMRFLRALRLLRILRIFKIGRYSNSLGTMGRVFAKKRDDLLITFFLILILLVVFANLMFYIENSAQPDVFSNVFQAMWWGIVTVTGVGYGDIYPITTLGKVLGGFIAILGIVTVALPIGILGAAYVEDTEKKQKGKIRQIHSSDHIIICGYNRITKSVLEDLIAFGNDAKIVLVTQRPNPEIGEIIYVNADWTDIDVLKRLSIEHAAACVIMAEGFSGMREDINNDVIDMRTIFTLYKIKINYPNVHTVIEVINPEHIEMVKSNIKGDEVILKEIIDGNLVANCVKMPSISHLLYEIISLEGKVIRETTVKKIGLDDQCPYGDVIKYGIDKEITFIGYIRGEESVSQLSPGKKAIIRTTDRLIYVTERAAGK